MAAPTTTHHRSAPARARFAALLVIAALAFLAGCSTIGSLAALIEDLRDEGFGDVSVTIDQRDTSVLVVSADAPGGTAVGDAQDKAADVVWTRFPRRFDGLRVTIDGERAEWTYEELEDELGPRPEGLEDGDLGDDVNRVAVIGLIGVLVAGLVGIGIIVLVVVLVVRSSRRKAAAGPPTQPWMPPGVPTAGGPVPPPGGWAPASAPPGPPRPPGPSAPPGPPTWSGPVDPTTPRPWAPPPPTPPSLAKDPLPPASPGEATTPLGSDPDRPGTPADEDTHPAAPPHGPGTPPPAPDGAPTAVPPGFPPPAGPPPTRRPRDPEARRLGRRPRGPKPDKAHTPPGWD